ncbi:MAG TPA: HAD family phosphatase [Streptosporangiaceae bacterium]|nr:HAD family phosphatase [Streptosporangiaceae bacterium]
MPEAAVAPGDVAVPCESLVGVLFDMDGVLVDSEPIWFEVERAVMTRLGGQWTDADQQALVGGSLYRTVDYLIERATVAAGHADVAGWLLTGMEQRLRQSGVEPVPGAVELVEAVRSAGLPCALVTSSEPVIVSAVLGALARYQVTFDAIVSGADVRNPKPDPEPYLSAAALLGLDSRCCVAIEDSPNGVASARGAGCVTVAVPGLAALPDTDGVVVAASLADVSLEWLRELVLARFRGV